MQHVPNANANLTPDSIGTADRIGNPNGTSDTAADARSDNVAESNALVCLYHNRQLFSVRRLRLLAQLPVKL